jgi:hypothetical protein
MWEGYGKGRVGIDGCWQSLDTVYDVFSTYFFGNGVYGFSVADFFSPADIMILVAGLSRLCYVAWLNTLCHEKYGKRGLCFEMTTSALNEVNR